MAFITVAEQPMKEVIAGYKGRAIHTGTMTYLFWQVDEGAEMPLHSHMHEQVAQVLKGAFELNIEGQVETLIPGKVAVIPPYVRHGGKAITSCELLDVFLPEREDYKF